MVTKLEQAMKRLEASGNEKVRALNIRNGAGGSQFGVTLGDIRKLASALEGDHGLAMQLWETGNLDARLLGVLLLDPEQLSPTELGRLVRQADVAQLADWLNGYVVKQHPAKESLRKKWMSAKDSWTQRAGWSLTAERVAKDPQGLELDDLLDHIEKHMGRAVPEVQWTMNTALAAIGIHHGKQRARAIAIGEKLGVTLMGDPAGVLLAFR